MSLKPVMTGRGLTKRYGRVTAMDGADFELFPGEILAIIGDNGAGKSTLVKALCGAIHIDEGEIRLDDQPVTFKSPMDARDAGIETVYQNLALSPALSIADNMFLGREIYKEGVAGSVFRMLDKKQMRDFARRKLTELGLMTVQSITQAVETLSGGQRQGVAVARAAAEKISMAEVETIKTAIPSYQVTSIKSKSVLKIKIKGRTAVRRL